MYTNVGSLCSTGETNTVLYVSYTSMKKEIYTNKYKRNPVSSDDKCQGIVLENEKGRRGTLDGAAKEVLFER